MSEDTSPTVGHYLKSMREKKSISLDKVAELTRINLTVLKDIEENNLTRLPNKTYVKGFIRSFSRVVGADDKLAIHYFDSECKEPEQTLVLEKISPQTNDKNYLPPIIAATVTALFLFVLLSLSRTPTTPTPAAQKMVKVAPKVEVKTKVALAPPVVKVVTPPVVKKAKARVPTRKISTPLYEVLPNAVENKDQSLLPSSIAEQKRGDRNHVYINAKSGNTWLTYKTDANPIRSFTLQQGKSLLIKGKEIRIFMGNIHATKIFYNGQLVSAKSESGVKSLIFPSQSVAKFSLPLFVHKEDGTVETNDQNDQSRDL